MKKTVLLLALTACMISAFTGCQKRISGTIDEALPEQVEQVIGKSMEMESWITGDDTNANIMYEQIDEHRISE